MELSREQILAHRRRASGLDERLAYEPDALRRSARSGLADSVPRSAVLSIHARVADTPVEVLDDPALVQVWGPRFSAYVVADDDRAPFTLGRLPESGPRRDRAVDIAERLRRFLDGRTMSYADAGRAMGVNPNALRYATLTGTVVVRWEGSGRPVITSVPPPVVGERDAALELVRRFLHELGPATADDFGAWAGVRPTRSNDLFESLAEELITVRTPIGDAVALAADEGSLHADGEPPRGVRLLPSGDVHYLLWDAQRELLVPGAARRAELWTSRVWPGALLVDGEVVGTWRRSGARVEVHPWVRVTDELRERVDTEAASLPLPVDDAITVVWPS